MKADDAGLRSASDTSKSSVLFVWFLFFWVHQTVALRWCCADVIREVGGTNALSWRCVCWPVDLCVFPETDTQESTDRKLQTWRPDGVRCENVALVGSTQILLTVARCVEARVTSHPVWLDWSREGARVCVCVCSPAVIGRYTGWYSVLLFCHWLRCVWCCWEDERWNKNNLHQKFLLCVFLEYWLMIDWMMSANDSPSCKTFTLKACLEPLEGF